MRAPNPIRWRHRLRRPFNFDYTESRSYRTYHADGVFGGLTTRGNLHLVFYRENKPLPQQSTYVVAGNRLREELIDKRKAPENLQRVYEAGVVLDSGALEAFLLWLQSKVQQSKEREQLEREMLAAEQKDQKE